MKRLFLLAPIVVAFSACGSLSGNNDPYTKRAEIQREIPIRHVKSTLDQIPSWMTKLPYSSDAIFENGTATSFDLAMADTKALSIAYGKICMTSGGRVKQQNKMYRSETETTGKELSEMTLRTGCNDMDLTGVEVKEIKRISEGNKYRTFVLIALPLGEANFLKNSKESKVDAETQNNYVNNRAPQAFKELDNEKQ